jgi:uncharacterized protein YlxP (DUF503 family)
MFVAACRLEVSIPGAFSLKDKRQVLQSLTSRVRKQFPIAIAEIEDQELWNAAVLGMAVVSNNGSHAREVLEKTVRFLENARLDAEIGTVEFDLLQTL